MSEPTQPNPIDNVSNPWLKRRELGLLKAAFQTVKLLLFSPKQFFQNWQPAPSKKDVYILYLLLELPITAVSLYMDPVYDEYPWAVYLVPMFLAIGPFISAVTLHWPARWLGGKGSFKDTFAIFTYASAATVIFSIIPVVGPFASWVWCVVIATIGVHLVHKLSVPKAILVYFFLPVLMSVTLALIIALQTYAQRRLQQRVRDASLYMREKTDEPLPPENYGLPLENEGDYNAHPAINSELENSI